MGLAAIGYCENVGSIDDRTAPLYFLGRFPPSERTGGLHRLLASFRGEKLIVNAFVARWIKLNSGA
jgi:hypothetical protein